MLRGKHHRVSLLPSDPDIHLDGHSTEKGDFYECLGVQVDETLLWSSTHRTLTTNYKPFTLSYFDYCSAVVLLVLVFVKKLKKCKIGGVRIISASHCWVRSGQILPDHNLVSLVNRRGEQMKTLMF